MDKFRPSRAKLNSGAYKYDSYPIAIVGAKNVGKATFVRKFGGSELQFYYEWGGRHLPFMEFTKELEKDRQARNFRIYFEYIGSEQNKRYLFNVIRPYLTMNCLAFILIFDLTSRSTLDTLNYVAREIFMDKKQKLRVYDVTPGESRQWRGGIMEVNTSTLPKILVANKKDLIADRKILTDTVQATAKEFGIQYIETSALTGENVQDVFNHLVYMIENPSHDVTE